MMQLVRIFSLLLALAMTGAVQSEELKQEHAGYIDRAQTSPFADLPLVVFLPGFMGSTITRCEDRCTKSCKVVWGPGAATYDLSFHDSQCHHYQIYTDDRFVLGLIHKELYARLEETMETALGPHVQTLKLAYDWRRAPHELVNHVTRTLCAESTPGRRLQLFFLAHSYGGLVLREWLSSAAHPFSCPDGSTREFTVKQVAFAATPHLGTPSTIQELVDGYKIDRSSRLTIAAIEDAITKYGLKMGSTFALLPHLSDARCEDLRQLSSGSRFVVPQSLAIFTTPLHEKKFRAIEVNIFDAKEWTRYNLLRKYKSTAFTDDIAKIQEKLDANGLRCIPEDPATHVDDPKGQVIYVYAAVQDSTPETAFIRTYDKDLTFDVIKGAGDGRVPVYSAINVPFLKATDKSFAVKVTGENADHLQILQSDAVADLLQDWRQQINGDEIRRTDQTQSANEHKRPVKPADGQGNSKEPSAEPPPEALPTDVKRLPRRRASNGPTREPAFFYQFQLLPLDPTLLNSPRARAITQGNIEVLKAHGIASHDKLVSQLSAFKSKYAAAFVAFTGGQSFPDYSFERADLTAIAMMLANYAQQSRAARQMAQDLIRMHGGRNLREIFGAANSTKAELALRLARQLNVEAADAPASELYANHISKMEPGSEGSDTVFPASGVSKFPWNDEDPSEELVAAQQPNEVGSLLEPFTAVNSKDR